MTFGRHKLTLCEHYSVRYWSHENIYIKFSLMTNIDIFMSNLNGLEAKKANIYLVATFQPFSLKVQDK